MAWQTRDYHGMTLPPVTPNLSQQKQYLVRVLLPREEWSLVFVEWCKQLLDSEDASDSISGDSEELTEEEVSENESADGSTTSGQSRNTTSLERSSSESSLESAEESL